MSVLEALEIQSSSLVNDVFKSPEVWRPLVCNQRCDYSLRCSALSAVTRSDKSTDN